jgi:plasmid maintenance system antidote protein VapI
VIAPDTALRLARVTGMSADFGLGLQQGWDLWHALRSATAHALRSATAHALRSATAKEIARLEPLKQAS